MSNKNFLINMGMILLLVIQAFYLGWYSGKNHERLEWSMREINCQADLARETVRNEILADLVH